MGKPIKNPTTSPVVAQPDYPRAVMADGRAVMKTVWDLQTTLKAPSPTSRGFVTTPPSGTALDTIGGTNNFQIYQTNTFDGWDFTDCMVRPFSQSGTPATITFNNCLLKDMRIGVDSNGNDQGMYVCSVVFNNCRISGYVYSILTGSSTSVQFNNCRLENTGLNAFYGQAKTVGFYRCAFIRNGLTVNYAARNHMEPIHTGSGQSGVSYTIDQCYMNGLGTNCYGVPGQGDAWTGMVFVDTDPVGVGTNNSNTVLIRDCIIHNVPGFQAINMKSNGASVPVLTVQGSLIQKGYNGANSVLANSGGTYSPDGTNREWDSLTLF